MLEPYPLSGRSYGKSNGRSVPTIRQVATQKVACVYDGDVSEVFLALHAIAVKRVLMNSNRRDLDEIIAQTERLGDRISIIHLSISTRCPGSHNPQALGELALFRYNQEAPHYALGQITEVQLRNVWHEDLRCGASFVRGTC